jgi:hypothetical protein
MCTIILTSIYSKVPANIPPLCCGTAGAGAEYEGAWAGGGATGAAFATGAGAGALLAYAFMMIIKNITDI